MENNSTIVKERSQPKEIVLAGVYDSLHEQELLQTMQLVFERLKSDKSNLRARRRLHEQLPNKKNCKEIKSAAIADICIAFITSGAAVAAINAIASVIGRCQTTSLEVYHNSKMIYSIRGKGFTDTAQVERLAARMIKSNVELRLHVDDSMKVERSPQ